MSDKLKTIFEEYSTEFKECSNVRPQDFEGIPSLYNGVLYRPSKEYYQAQLICISEIQKLLGIDKVSEIEIRDTLLDIVTSDFSDFNDSYKTLCARLEHLKQTEARYFAPNFIINLCQGVESLTIGKVKCILTSDLGGENFVIPTQVKISESFEHTNTFVVGADNYTLTIGLSKQCFIIQTPATAKNVESIAAWYVDIAASLVRYLCYITEYANGLFPKQGEREHPPFIEIKPGAVGFAIDHEGFYCRGSGVIPSYRITTKIVESYIANNFSVLCDSIFEPTKNSIGERMQRALAWMSRARQAISYQERFLFFFTALEALLTPPDRDDPIADTIARHVSTILALPENRLEIYTKMKALYGIRSSLVHSGKRCVAESDCNLLQHLTEMTCFDLLEKNLNETISDFQHRLKSAGFGLPFREVDCDEPLQTVTTAAGDKD